LTATEAKEPAKAKQPKPEEPVAAVSRSAKSTRSAPEAKAEAKTTAKTEAKAETKSEAKPEAKTPLKTEAKSEAKAEAKTEVKAHTAAKSPEKQDGPIEAAQGAADAPPSPEMDDVRSRWKDFVNAMRGEGSKGNLDAFLRNSCEPLSIEDNTLTLGFYYKFHKEYIEDPKYKHLVEKKLHEVFGHSYRVRCVLTPAKAKAKTEGESPLVRAARESYGATIIGRKPRSEEE